MIGPSSSHTAGVVRIGRVARRVLGGQPEAAEVTFYNSFARTYEGHGSDRAVIGGLMDFKTDDERIRDSLQLAVAAGLEFKFRAVTNASALHPNSVKVVLRRGDAQAEVVGISRGGGLISIIEIDGYRCNFTAQHHTVIIGANDVKGSIAFIATVLSHDACNIATMTVDRKAKNHKARLVLEIDSGLRPLTREYMESQEWIDQVIYIPDIDL